MQIATLSDQRTIGSAAADRPLEESSRPASVFVWSVWALIFLSALRFAWRCGSPVPHFEDWFWVPYVLGETPISLSWIWEQYFEHRAPLLKLLLYGSFSVFGLDERPILFLNVGLFGLLALAMMWAVRKVRGRSIYSDAFFPLALLNLGHAETFFWAGTFVYVATTFLCGMILVILFVTGSRLTVRSATLAGICLVLLPLCFGGGLVYAACMSWGLGYFGLGLIRSEDYGDRKAGWILLAFVGITLLIVALYFVGYRDPRFGPMMVGKAGRSPVTVLKITLKFLTEVFGWGGRYPFSRPMGSIMVALLAITGGCLVTELLHRWPRGWPPLLGLGFHLGSCLAVALAVGWGRAPWGPEALDSSRYAAAAAPTLLSLYFTWEVCGPPRVRPFGRAALCSLVFAFLALNWMKGSELGEEHRRMAAAFQADVRAGTPIPQLISRHAFVTYYVHERLERYLRLLRDSRYGDYSNLPADPLFREVHLTPPPSAVTGLVWDGKGGRATSDAPEMVFDLAYPMWIAGIRMKYSSVNPGGWNPVLQVGWRACGEGQTRQWRAYQHILLKSDSREVVVPVWIYDTVDRIRICPDKRPCDFTLSEIVLLVPEGEPMLSSSGWEIAR